MAVHTFQFCGQQFTYVAELPATEWAELRDALDSDADSASQYGIEVALRCAVAMTVPEERKRFRAVSRQKEAKAVDWLKVAFDWLPADAERPTSEPGDSSPGLEGTPEPSALPDDEQASVLPIRPDMAAAMHRSGAPTARHSATG